MYPHGIHRLLNKQVYKATDSIQYSYNLNIYWVPTIHGTIWWNKCPSCDHSTVNSVCVFRLLKCLLWIWRERRVFSGERYVYKPNWCHKPIKWWCRWLRTNLLLFAYLEEMNVVLCTDTLGILVDSEILWAQYILQFDCSTKNTQIFSFVIQTNWPHFQSTNCIALVEIRHMKYIYESLNMFGQSVVDREEIHWW